MSERASAGHSAAGFALLAVAALLPGALAASGHIYLLNLLTRLFAVSIAVVSLDLLVGFGGLLSLGHAAYFAVAGYCVGVLATHGAGNAWIQIAAAVGLSAFAAFLTGLVAVRTAGIYFLMITLALAQLFYYLAVGSEALGGDDGFAFARGSFGGPLSLDRPAVLCYASLAALCLCLYAMRGLVRSRFGQALQGIRANERRMRALGCDTVRCKLAAFVIAGAACGLGGALFVSLKAYVSPAYMHWTRSGELLIMLLIGGIGTLHGAILGVAVVQAFDTLLPLGLERIGSGLGPDWLLVFGIFLVALALAPRHGLARILVPGTSSARADLRSASASLPAALRNASQSCEVRTAAPAALRIANLRKSFGGVTATDGLSLVVAARELHAIIGPNGAGKTTLIAQIAGELAPDTGEIFLDDRRITRLSVARRARLGIARSYQVSSVLGGFTALENVALAAQCQRPGPLHPWKPSVDAHLVAIARAALAEVGLVERAATRASELSHGEQRRLELAMVLAMQPRVLLLDEPLAGVGAEESQHLLETLGRMRGRYTIILIEHDVDAVFRLADRVTVLVSGACVASGPPAAVRADAAVQAAYLGPPAEVC